MTKKEIQALSQEDAHAKIEELLKAQKDAEKAHAEAVKAKDDELKEQSSVMEDMQATIDELSRRKDDSKVKPEIKHGKKTYQVNIRRFRLGPRVVSLEDLEKDSSLVAQVLKIEGQSVLTEKKN